MDQVNEKIKREKIRGGMFFAVLSLVLLFITVIGFFINLSPKNSLSRAIENTKEDLFGGEDVLFFVKDAFLSGSISLTGEDETIVHVGAFPKGADLLFQSGKKKTEFSVSGSELSMTHPGSKKIYQASVQDAAVMISDSAFSDAGISEEYLLLLRIYFALTENGTDFLPVLSDALASAWDAASPSLTVKNTEEGQENTYQLSPEGLMLFFSQISEEGKKEEVKKALSSVLDLTLALSDTKTDAAKKEAALSFLTGSGEGFDAFCKKTSDENGASALTVLTRKNRVRKVTLSVSGADLTLNGTITFGENLKKDGAVSAVFSVAEGEAKTFSLKFSHKISEDSDSALIRTWKWSLSDPKGYLLSDREASDGEITFSWGKRKGDLGLRLSLGDEKINFRGAVGDYKRGKEITCTLKRMELENKNVLTDPMTVKISKDGKLPAFKKGEKELFPQGEERAALAEILKKFPY